MPCYKPIPAFRSRDGSVVFSERATRNGGGSVGNLWLPCGQCVGCRLERSRRWAVRCVHEASLNDANCFITLTYDDEHLPADGSLNYRHFQLFLKRLRKHFSRVVHVRNGSQIKKHLVSLPVRYYMCGEYGEDFSRPHYHAILFGIDFGDKVPVRFLCQSKIFTSPTLERLWPFGYSSIGEANFESAAYIARYCMKKVTGDLADAHYTSIDADGVITKRVPEFNHMSLKPGIGAEWFRRYKSDVYPDGKVVMRGHQCKAPRYYDKLLERDDGEAYDDLLYRRYLESLKFSGEQTDARLAVREQVANARVNSLKRSL